MPRRIARERCGDEIEIQFFKDGFLPAIAVELLFKISLRIEQSNADERQTQVAGLFDVIARENPQSARINRQ